MTIEICSKERALEEVTSIRSGEHYGKQVSIISIVSSDEEGI